MRRRQGSLPSIPAFGKRSAFGRPSWRWARWERTVRTVARVESDETKRVAVTTKFDGWIERLYVNETGQFVKKGDPLLAIYSPEVVAGQEEYLLAREQGNPQLIRSARDRLRFWDLSEGQIAGLERRGRPKKTVILYSPNTGYVLSKKVTEGMKVESDRAMFLIVDLASVWVKADIYEYEVPWVEVGQTAELSLSYIDGKTFRGRVGYIYPFLDESSRTVQIRLEFENPALDLKPGMFGSVAIRTSVQREQLLVPSEAVLRSGRRNIVFLDQGDGYFQPNEVTLGPEGDRGLVSVTSGLQAGQRIVVSAQFLLDSESRLSEVLQRFEAADQPASTPSSQPSSRPVSQPSSQPVSQPARQPAPVHSHKKGD